MLAGFAGDLRRGLVNHFTSGILDAIDVMGHDLEAAVREDRVGKRDLHLEGTDVRARAGNPRESFAALIVFEPEDIVAVIDRRTRGIDRDRLGRPAVVACHEIEEQRIRIDRIRRQQRLERVGGSA